MLADGVHLRGGSVGASSAGRTRLLIPPCDGLQTPYLPPEYCLGLSVASATLINKMFT